MNDIEHNSLLELAQYHKSRSYWEKMQSRKYPTGSSAKEACLTMSQNHEKWYQLILTILEKTLDAH